MDKIRKFGRYSLRVFNGLKHKDETANLNLVTNFIEEKFLIIWRIENLHRCMLENGEFLESPSFTAGSSSEVKWTLRFYPKGRKTKKGGPYSNANNSENAGLFINRVSGDPGTETFKCALSCERKLLNSVSLMNTTYFYPEKGFVFAVNIANSAEHGTDNFTCKDMKLTQTLVVKCEIYVTKAYNTEAPGNKTGFSKSESLFQDLKTLHDNGKFSDITLQAGDMTFPAHKVILAARSEVFDAMFQHDMKETQTNVVRIENIEPAILGDMLQYIYTGSVDDFNIEKASALYSVADKYFLQELKIWCIDVMLANLTVENVCQIALLADLHPDPKLKEATFNMFRNYTSDIFKRKEWQDLVHDTDRRALVSDILQAVSADFTTNCSDVK